MQEGVWGAAEQTLMNEAVGGCVGAVRGAVQAAPQAADQADTAVPCCAGGGQGEGGAGCAAGQA